MVVAEGWSSEPSRPPEPSKPPPRVVVEDELGAASSEESVVVELLALGSVVGISVELGSSATVVVALSLDVGFSSDPRFRRPPCVVEDSVELAEVDVEFEAPLLVLEVSAGTLAGPLVDVVTCEGGSVCASAAVLSCVLEDVLSVEGCGLKKSVVSSLPVKPANRLDKLLDFEDDEVTFG